MKRKHVIVGTVCLIMVAGISTYLVQRTNLVDRLKALEIWGTVKTYAEEKFEAKEEENELEEDLLQRLCDGEVIHFESGTKEYELLCDEYFTDYGYTTIREDGVGIGYSNFGLELDCQMVFYTEDYGESWTNYSDFQNMYMGSIAMSNDEKVLMASLGRLCTRAFLYYSDDFGEHFDNRTLDPYDYYTVDILTERAVDGAWMLGWRKTIEEYTPIGLYPQAAYECIELYDTDLNYIKTVYANEDTLIPYLHSVQCMEGESIFPTSNEEKLRKKDIVNQINIICEQNPALKPEVVLRLAINEIYARKKYDFTNTKYEIYFRNMDWYSTDGYVVTEAELTAAERANIDTMVALEDQKVFCK